MFSWRHCSFSTKVLFVLLADRRALSIRLHTCKEQQFFLANTHRTSEATISSNYWKSRATLKITFRNRSHQWLTYLSRRFLHLNETKTARESSSPSSSSSRSPIMDVILMGEVHTSKLQSLQSSKYALQKSFEKSKETLVLDENLQWWTSSRSLQFERRESFVRLVWVRLHPSSKKATETTWETWCTERLQEEIGRRKSWFYKIWCRLSIIRFIKSCFKY